MEPSTLTLNEHAYRQIRGQLLSGSLPGGVRLSDVALSKKLGISRTPVREAISRLVSDGLVERIPRLGAFAKTLGRRDIEELYQLRELLEGFAAAGAAERITDTALAELQKACDEMRGIVREMRAIPDGKMDEDLEMRGILADFDFHRILISAAGNLRLKKIIRELRITSQTFAFRGYDPSRSIVRIKAVTWLEHRRVLQCLRRRDGESARRQIVSHIRKGCRQAVAAYEWRRAGNVPDGHPEALQRLISKMEGRWR